MTGATATAGLHFPVPRRTDKKVLMAEHAACWRGEKVELGQATASSGKSGDAAVENTDFRKATWKGDPTVVRSSAIGPFGPQDQMLLVTYRAAPEGDKIFGPAVQTMIGDIGFKWPR